MNKFILILYLILTPFFIQAQCTTNNATSCSCKDGTSNCDILPDIIVARPPLTVSGTSGNIEYPQVCPGGCSGNDGRLRISVSSPNIGFGPLEVRAINTIICGTDTFVNPASGFVCPNGDPLRQLVNQRVYHKNGAVMTYYDRPAGSMTYHPSHGHMHVDEWGTYSLRTATSNPDPLSWPIIANGAKLAFCLMDYGSCSTYAGHCVDATGSTLLNANFPNYGLGGGAYGCSPTIQGISSGYTDIYYQHLDGMWINLPPGLCNGQYWIVVHLDPHNYFLESNENNNTIAVPITLTQQSGVAPVITASGATSFCQGGSVTLTASVASNYLWSNGATTQSIIVTQSGSYTVAVNTTTTCSATSAATVVTVTPIAVNASGTPTTVCPGEPIQLTASATSTGVVNQSVNFTNLTVYSIPDNNTTGVTSTIAVSGLTPTSLTTTSIVSVKINISHTYDSDLVISLISPSGNTINLSNKRGGSGDNFVNTIFSTSASSAISTGAAPFTGTYLPEAAFSSLTGNMNGNWKLKVVDAAKTDIGTIINWTITLKQTLPTTLSYAWTSNPVGFSATGTNVIVNPLVPTSYTVNVTESVTGCTGSLTVPISVVNTTHVTANTPSAICVGSSITLTASGASTYVWSPSTGLSATTGASVTANPVVTTNYKVVGTIGGCKDSINVTVSVIPTISVSGFAPLTGPIGSTVVITGNNFTGATAVLFNGIFCSTFTVNSISQITAIVPLGATTGLVSVQRGICSGVSLGTYTVATNVTLNLKMFIQGYYIGSGLMKPVLLNSGMTIDPQMVDWVTVELHNSLSPNTISGTDTKLLHIDGNIQLNFTSTVLGGCYYIVIKHRNSLTTWSKDPITLTSITNFDLTH